MNGTAIANQRFTMIANILPVIDDERARGKEITRAALEYGVSKPTIRRYYKSRRTCSWDGCNQAMI